MKIIVTGGCGFVGNTLVKELLKDKNNNILVIDNLIAGNRVVHKGAQYIYEDAANIESICKRYDMIPDIVYHLGEFSRIAKSFDDPLMVINNNTCGTQRVTEYCSATGAKLVYSGSSAIFGDTDGSRSPYAYSKNTNVALIKNYGKWFNLKYAICYFYNVFGEGEIQSGSHATLIGTFMRQYREEFQPLSVVSPGTQTRIFTHIDDIVAGIIKVGKEGEGDNYHLSGESEHSVIEIAEMFGCEYEMVPERPGERGESAHMHSRAKEELKWKPQKLLADYIASKVKKYCIGIVGNGFVGQANALLSCKRIKTIIYDIFPEKCSPLGTTLADLSQCDVIFVAVPTPKQSDGKCSTKFVESAVSDIRNAISNDIPICIRSTVPVGFCESISCHFMPEFLTEKNWKYDFINCPVWVIGVDKENDKYIQIMSEIFATAAEYGSVVSKEITVCTTKEAELLKYMKNTFLATKVSFCNEMYSFCKFHNIDYDAVSTLFGNDVRIGHSHVAVPGHDGRLGYGGTCFPKDVHSLVVQMKEVGLKPIVLEAANYRNEHLDRPEKDWEQDKNRAVV